MSYFKRYLKTFLLLHLIFSIILLAGYHFVLGQTGELFSYAFLFALTFGLIATLVQSMIFSVIASLQHINRFLFFVIAFILELTIANFILTNSNSGDKDFTINLIKDIKAGDTKNDLMESLITHVSILASTLITSLVRSPYKSAVN